MWTSLPRVIQRIIVIATIAVIAGILGMIAGQYDTGSSITAAPQVAAPHAGQGAAGP